LTHRPVLHQIEANIRAVGRQERAIISQPHFELFISPAQDERLSYATPLLPDPADWTAPVAQMQAAFAQQGKRPRLEYIADLHPGLADALERAGLVCQSRAPVMVLNLADLSPPPRQRLSADYWRLTAVDTPLLRTYLTQQSIAYGGAGGPEALDWLPNLQSGLVSGDLMGAVLSADGALLSGAIIQMGADIGELAGVWTDPNWRSQGLAYALCQRLLLEYAALGHSACWLSAAEGAQRLYEKLGFVSVGTQLNYALGSAD
jgi:ribosomal protein S18 acetylase RimI-like enzyme